MSIWSFFKKGKQKIAPYEFGCALYFSLINDKWNIYMEDMAQFKNINFSKLTDAERIAYLEEFRLFLSSLIAGVLLSTFESDTLSLITNGFADSFFKYTKNTLPFQSAQEVKDILLDRCNTYLPIWRSSMKESKDRKESLQSMGLGGAFLKKAFGRDIDDIDLLFISDTLFYLTTFFGYIPEAINEFLSRVEVAS